MKRILLVMVFTLSGCVSMQQLDNGLSQLMDQNITVAFSALGYPTATQKFDGVTVYVWQNYSQGIVIIPSTSTSYGTFNHRVFQGFHQENTAIPVNYSCQIKLGVNDKNIIVHYEYDGDVNGCMLYINRMKRYFGR